MTFKEGGCLIKFNLLCKWQFMSTRWLLFRHGFLLNQSDHKHNLDCMFILKVARRLKLKNLPECYEMSGGGMVEHMACHGDTVAFPVPRVTAFSDSCNFSFAGIKSHYLRYIEEEEKKQGNKKISNIYLS